MAEDQTSYDKQALQANLCWLNLFFTLPNEFLEKRKEYMEIPKKVKEVMASEKWLSLIASDVFLELVWDSYAFVAWNFFEVPYAQKSGRRPIPGSWGDYSGDFPLWKMAYMIPHLILKKYGKTPMEFYDLFRMMGTDFSKGVSYPVFALVVGTLTRMIVKEQNWQPLIDEAWQHRDEKDYNGNNSWVKRDFLRSWRHTRNPEAEESPEEHLNKTANENMQDTATDSAIKKSSERFEEQVVQDEYMQEFAAQLTEKDKQIIEMRMKHMTMAEIAKELGYSNAGAVSKRIDKLLEKYYEFGQQE